MPPPAHAALHLTLHFQEGKVLWRQCQRLRRYPALCRNPWLHHSPTPSPFASCVRSQLPSVAAVSAAPPADGAVVEAIHPGTVWRGDDSNLRASRP